MKVQSFNNNASFGAYYRGSLIKSHAKIVAPLTTELEKMGEKIHLCIASGKSWNFTSHRIEPCLRITAHSINAMYAPPYIDEIFLKSTNTTEKILQTVKKLSNYVLN